MTNIYTVANQAVDEYEAKGISGQVLLNHLNASTKNFQAFVARVRNAVDVTDDNLVAEICKDVVRDRLALINDITK